MKAKEFIHLLEGTHPDQQPGLFSWERNVQDHYKSWSNEEIKEDLKKRALPFGILAAQVEGDFNFSSCVRTANNFNASKIYYYGPKKHWDRRGCCGVYHYSPVEYLKTIEEVRLLKKDFVFVGLENNVDGTVPIQDFRWPSNSLIIVGEENSGLPKELLELVDHRVEIPTCGSIRSLNLGAAFSIAAYSYWIQHHIKKL